MSDLINCEVAYALPTQQAIVSVAVKPDATVEEVITASTILQQFPDIDLSKTKVGIWSRVVKLRDSVSDGDRIEIYRPLIADPKEIRKRRAEKAKEEGVGSDQAPSRDPCRGLGPTEALRPSIP